MNKVNMETIKLLVEDELYDFSRADKNTIYDSINWLLTDLEIYEAWIVNSNKQDKSLERYIFDGVIEFMKDNNITPDELYNYEDQTEIFDYIHR